MRPPSFWRPVRRPKKLGVEGEDEMLGRGVHYYAACRSMMYRRKTVAVIGEGEQAAEAAMLLSRIAKRICLVHGGEHMEISPRPMRAS